MVADTVDPEPAGDNDALARLMRTLADLAEEAPAQDPSADAAAAEPSAGGRAEGVTRRFGDFEILGQLGQGGMGIVYEVRQRSLGNRRVALKILPPYFSLDPRRVARFRTEAVTASKVGHSGIVTVLDVGEHEGTHYLVQELIEGGRTLADHIREQRDALVPAKADHRRLASQFASIADALQAVHEAKVLHRDINPTNILLTPRGEPKVADFGLAKDLDAEVISASGDSPGTPSYKSPEQIDPSRGPVDARSDVFALGATLYEALTHVRAFQGESAAEIYEKICSQDVVDPRAILAGVPRELALICGKALEKDADRRYPSMREFELDLRRFLANEPIRARPPSIVRRGILAARRHPVLSVSLAAAVILATISGAANLFLQRKNTQLELARTAEKEQADLATKRGAELQTRMHLYRLRALELAEQRGDWYAVIEAVDQIRKETQSAIDPEFILRQARACVALSRHDSLALLEELRSISRNEAIDAHRRLLEADVELMRNRSLADAFAPLPESLEAGLEGADLHYARALLAKDTPTAGKELRAALAIDPFHYRATTQELLLRIFEGRWEEAQSLAELFRRQRPSDVLAASTLAFVHLRAKRVQEANEALSGLSQGGEIEARTAVEANVSMLEVFDHLFEHGSAIGDPNANALARFLAPRASFTKDPDQDAESAELAQQLRKSFAQSMAQSPAFGALGLQLPALRRAWAHATEAMLLIRQEKFAEARELLALASSEHPDACFAFMEASCWTTSHDNTPEQKLEHFRRAVDIFGTAVDRGSLVNGVERAARFLRLRCACELIRHAGEGDRKAQVLDDMRWFLRVPDVTMYELSTMAEESVLQGDASLGLRLVDEWLRDHPKNATALHLKTRMHFFLDQWPAARAAAERVLELKPKHAEAQKIFRLSVEKARAWADAHAEAKPPQQN